MKINCKTHFLIKQNVTHIDLIENLRYMLWRNNIRTALNTEKNSICHLSSLHLKMKHIEYNPKEMLGFVHFVVTAFPLYALHKSLSLESWIFP